MIDGFKATTVAKQPDAPQEETEVDGFLFRVFRVFGGFPASSQSNEVICAFAVFSVSRSFSWWFV
jgi:hypothetical protein